MSIPTKTQESQAPKAKTRSKGIAARQGAGAKARILTPDELELAEALQKALTNKVVAEVTLVASNQEIAQLTDKITKLDFARGNAVWAEAREKLGATSTPTQEELLRK